MPDAGDYFAWLGLAPGVYSGQELSDRLADIRAQRPDAGRLADATAAFNVLRDPARQSRHLRNLQEQADPPSRAPAPPGPEIESAFSAAVASMLEGDTGVLRYSNRRKLLDLAARMGIVPFEANLLIERARFRATLEPAWLAPAAAEQDSSPPSPPARRRRQWILAIALAILLDAIVIALLLI
ncbi:MAG: hypothetical protein PHU85_18865 [Phycisphaerae bacterium]|nr:hypothetical protein [Phycisphaerae bacterium]